jgi:hypothetical protein
MPRSRHALAFGRVNLLKKIKVGKEWKFCPAVVDPGRRLTDKVRVNGQIEIHNEGTYYIEWRECGKRRRQPVRSRALVLEQARLKALELEAQRNGHASGSPTLHAPITVRPEPAPPAPAQQLLSVPMSSGPLAAAHLIWKGIETYLQELIGAAVRSQLATLGMMPREAPAAPESGSTIEPQGSTKQPDPEPEFSLASLQPPAPNGKVLIAEAIESYLKDVEPPQREPKTYEEYRLVLGKFRETCSKRYVHEVNRDDCLAFMRHLYSSGNQARTVFNRMGIVLQLLKLHGVEQLLNKKDKPKFVKNVRKMYEPEDLEALFKASSADEKVLYLFFLLTGERDKEVRHTTWPDIDFVRKVVQSPPRNSLASSPRTKKRERFLCPHPCCKLCGNTEPGSRDLIRTIWYSPRVEASRIKNSRTS